MSPDTIYAWRCPDTVVPWWYRMFSWIIPKIWYVLSEISCPVGVHQRKKILKETGFTIPGKWECGSFMIKCPARFSVLATVVSGIYNTAWDCHVTPFSTGRVVVPLILLMRFVVIAQTRVSLMSAWSSILCNLVGIIENIPIDEKEGTSNISAWFLSALRVSAGCTHAVKTHRMSLL